MSLYVTIKMSAYRKEFDETRYISFLINDDKLLKYTIKLRKKLKITLKKNLIVNQFMMKSF